MRGGDGTVSGRDAGEGGADALRYPALRTGEGFCSVCVMSRPRACVLRISRGCNALSSAVTVMQRCGGGVPQGNNVPPDPARPPRGG